MLHLSMLHLHRNSYANVMKLVTSGSVLRKFIPNVISFVSVVDNISLLFSIFSSAFEIVSFRSILAVSVRFSTIFVSPHVADVIFFVFNFCTCCKSSLSNEFPVITFV